MSGIEVAGLVLGAIPVLIETLKFLKSGMQMSRIFFRRQAVFNKLTLALIFQQETLAQIIRSILIQSGCDTVLDFDHNPHDVLVDGQTQEHILEYLGEKNLYILTETLKQSYETVHSVAQNISCFVPVLERNPSESLREIVQLNSENERFWRDLVPRAKLMFSASDISKTVQDLDNVANGLWRMMSLISSNQQSVDQGSSRKALRLGKGFWQIRCLAEDLHQAILKAWKPGCHHSHEAKLFLEDRVETAANIFRTARSEAGFIALNFRVMFTASSPQNRVLGYATDVKVAEELASERISGPCETSVSQRARVTLVLPQSIPKTPSMPFVDDICDLLASLKRDKKQLALVLSKHQRISTLATKEGYLNLCDSVETIPLDALLCSSETNSERLDFPWKSRMTLALGLASGFLQLARTPWLQRSWAKDNIFFLRRPNTAGHCCDFTRPFISFAFNSDDACSQQSPSINPKAAVLELGILLLEIWNTKTLEKHFDKEQTPTQYYQRLALATEWLDDMSNPLPELYDKAVSHCIRGLIGGDSRFQDWEDTKFWGAVCQDIIGPLHEICKQWRSLPQA